jgi:hypothetical protein
MSAEEVTGRTKAQGGFDRQWEWEWDIPTLRLGYGAFSLMIETDKASSPKLRTSYILNTHNCNDVLFEIYKSTSTFGVFVHPWGEQRRLLLAETP